MEVDPEEPGYEVQVNSCEGARTAVLDGRHDPAPLLPRPDHMAGDLDWRGLDDAVDVGLGVAGVDVFDPVPGKGRYVVHSDPARLTGPEVEIPLGCRFKGITSICKRHDSSTLSYARLVLFKVIIKNCSALYEFNYRIYP